MAEGFRRMESAGTILTDLPNLFQQVFGTKYAPTTWRNHYGVWQKAPRQEIDDVAAHGETFDGRWKLLSAKYRTDKH